MVYAMYMQLNEQFIVDESGSKQAVVIPFVNYLKLLDILRRYDELTHISTISTVWQTDKGSPQVIQFWFASQRYQQFPTGDAIAIQQTVDELREDWGDDE